MKRKDRVLRTLSLYAASPGLFAIIAMIVIMRPLTAYADGFHGPEGMWRDLRRWARTGELHFPNWTRACRSHLRRHGAS